MALPTPDSLSLLEAIALLSERYGCSQDKAKDALRRAGLDGQLDAIGTVYLSAHPDPAFRVRHGVPKREALRPDAWASSIDWGAGTVGTYPSVFIRRTSIEAWLGARGATLSNSPLREAPERKIKDEIRAQYDKAAAANEKPPNVKEIIPLVQKALRVEGFDASGNRIQKLAEDEEFKNRRRKPGATLKSDQRRQVP